MLAIVGPDAGVHHHVPRVERLDEKRPNDWPF